MSFWRLVSILNKFHIFVSQISIVLLLLIWNMFKGNAQQQTCSTVVLSAGNWISVFTLSFRDFFFFFLFYWSFFLKKILLILPHLKGHYCRFGNLPICVCVHIKTMLWSWRKVCLRTRKNRIRWKVANFLAKIQTLRVNNSSIVKIKNVNISGSYFYID